MLTLNAPAKINWFLNITSKREDGYHNIESMMQTVTLFDTLTFESSDIVEVTTDAGIPADENLVYRAALVLKERFGLKSGAKITLKKEIAISAGLGGGSSDAAYAIIGLDKLWGLNLTVQERMELGSGVGSDVPFFFNGPAAVIKGRGDIVEPINISRSYTLLLVKPPVGISSAWAYKESGALRLTELTKKSNNIKLFCQALEEGDFSLLSSISGNDLEPCVVNRHPVIADIKKSMIAMGAGFSAMSGSGSTVFGVFDTHQDAEKAMKNMPQYWRRIVKTVTSYE